MVGINIQVSNSINLEVPTFFSFIEFDVVSRSQLDFTIVFVFSYYLRHPYKLQRQ